MDFNLKTKKMCEFLADNCIDYIQGTPGKFSFGIVIQGEFNEQLTRKTIKVLIERNPNTLIVVSTYPPIGENTEFEKQNINSGKLVYIFLKFPDKEKYPDFWKTNYYNQNLQRLSSFVGVRYIKQLNISTCLKIRSDSIFGKEKICEYFDGLAPELRIQNVKMSRKLVISDKSRRSCESQPEETIGDYFIFDHWLFGDTDDLLNFYDMRPGCSWNEGKSIQTNTSPETHLTECWMRNVNIIPSEGEGLAELSVKYFIVTDTIDVEFLWLKRENFLEYQNRGKEYLREIFDKSNSYHKCFTKQRWLEFSRSLKQ